MTQSMTQSMTTSMLECAAERCQMSLCRWSTAERCRIMSLCEPRACRLMAGGPSPLAPPTRRSPETTPEIDARCVGAGDRRRLSLRPDRRHSPHRSLALLQASLLRNRGMRLPGPRRLLPRPHRPLPCLCGPSPPRHLSRHLLWTHLLLDTSMTQSMTQSMTHPCWSMRQGGVR